MAFMMPVMKNNYDIYKDSRSRKTSECSSSGGGGGGSNGPTTLASAMGTPTAGMNGGRRRKVSECKSESFATSPTHGVGGGGNNYRMQMQRCQSSRAFPRNTSRSSHSSMLSPTRSFSQSGGGVGSSSVAVSGSVNGSPPKQTTTATSAAKHETKTGVSDGQNDFTKFHMRLVDKLRKSFRKDNAKRS